MRGLTAVLLTLTVAATGAVATATQANAAGTLITLAQSSPSNNPTPSWTFAGPATSYECSFGIGSPTSFTACTSPYTASALATDGTADGTYTFAVQDPLDPTTLSTADYVLDTKVGVTVTVASPTRSQKPVFTLQPDADVATEKCTMDSDPQVDCTTSFTPSANLSPGDHTLVVDVTDGVGNQASQSTTVNVLPGPGAPTITVTFASGPPATVSWSWPVASYETSACSLTTPKRTAVSVTCTGGAYTETIVDGNGGYSLTVTLTDDASNVGPATASPPFTFTAIVPVAPGFVTPLVPSYGQDPSPTWTFTKPSGATLTCQLTGPTVVASASCDGGTYQPPAPLTDGSWTLTVTALDAVGNTSRATSTYLYEAKPPAPTVNLPTTPGAPYQFTWTSPRSLNAFCRLVVLSGTAITTGVSACNNGTYNAPITVSGSYEVEVYLVGPTGVLGDVGTSAQLDIDLTRPVPPTLSLPALHGDTSKDKAPPFTVSGLETGATAVCWFTHVTTTRQGITSCTSGTYVPPLGSDGPYAIWAQQTDAAGNVSDVAQYNYLLDTGVPEAPVVTGPSGTSADTHPSYTIATFESGLHAVCTLTLNGNTAQSGDCGSPYEPTLAGEGTWVLHVTVTDDAGNSASGNSVDFVLDTVRPDSAVVTTPKSPSSNRMPVWTLSSNDATASAQCEVLGPTGGVVRAFSSCAISAAGSTYSLDLSDTVTALDGDYTLVVRLTDAARNTNLADAQGTYTLDTKPPNAVLVTPPDSPGNLRTPTWLLTGDSDAKLECSLSSPGAPGTYAPCAADPLVPGSGSFVADLTVADDDTYTLKVRSVDAARNTGPEVSTSYTLDTRAPATPRAPTTGPSPSQQPVAVWTFSLESGASGRCTLSSSRGALFTDVQCSSPFATDLDALNAGRDSDYVLTLRAVDEAGNTSGTVTGHYVLDRSAPSAPLITASPGSPNPDRSPTWSVQGNDSRDRVECRLTGTAKPTWAPCTDQVSYDLAPATRGTFVLEVRETDEAGNVSDTAKSADYVLDLTAPAPPAVLAPKPQRSNSTHPVFTITADKETVGLTCKVTRFDGVPAKAAPCADGPNAVDLSGIGRAEGPVVLAVQGTDAVGNSSGSASATYSFDSIPPATPSVLGPNPATGFDRQVEFNFGDTPDAASFLCSLRRSSQAGPVTTTKCASPDKVTLPSTGSYTLSVWAVDKAGNVSLRSASAGYTLLQSVPTVSAPSGPTSGSDPTPTWTLQIPFGYQADCVLGMPGGQALTYDCTSPVFAPRVTASFANLQAALNRTADPAQSLLRSTSFTPDLTGRPAGAYTLSARLRDALGHEGDYSPKAVYSYRPRTAGGQVPPVTAPGAGAPKPPVPTTLTKVPTAQGSAGTAANGRLGSSERAAGKGAKAASKPQSLPPGRFPTALPHLGEVPKVIGNTIAESLQKPTIPLLLVVIVVGFLLLQNQIDRRDPKLASAPVGAEPEMEFGPVLGRGTQGRTLEGGAPA